MTRPINFDIEKFVMVTREVINDESQLDKPVQKLVYAALCMYADNKTKKSHPSIKTLANKCCCSENSVRSAIAKLESLELIKVTRRKYRTKNYPNEYLICEMPKAFSE